MNAELIKGIEKAYSESTNLIVFALTGRTGSGCTTAATNLSKPINEISISEEDFTQPERKKISIAIEYATAQWIPFQSIAVSSVIFSFLVQESWEAIDKFLVDKRITDFGRQEMKEQLAFLTAHKDYIAFTNLIGNTANADDKSKAWKFFSTELHERACQIRRVLAGTYPSLFQNFGDNLRFSGYPLKNEIAPEKLFTLMERVRQFVEAAEAYQRCNLFCGARVTIDAIRNPLELVYLRKHIPGLYVLAITVDDEMRRARLMDGGLGKKEVANIDEKEYGSGKHLQDYATFVSQNLRDCIQKSDIFISNPGKIGYLASSVRALNAQLIRYVALALRPGLITPTRDERCMQIAFVAKLNSGCISRQVGAVVADQNYSIQSIGWNDTPKGQTPCLLRDVNALLSGNDAISFSEYEKTDQKFIAHIEEKFSERDTLRQDKGLRCPFCFKDAYNTITKKENQVHTRSLHAEENAFLQLAKRGSAGIFKGILYTTSSPCELCSKKAYQLGISEVVYVDPYPGISTTHVLKSGEANLQPKLLLFNGAIGHAYHRLYDSLLSIKDEYRARLGNN